MRSSGGISNCVNSIDTLGESDVDETFYVPIPNDPEMQYFTVELTIENYGETYIEYKTFLNPYYDDTNPVINSFSLSNSGNNLKLLFSVSDNYLLASVTAEVLNPGTDEEFRTVSGIIYSGTIYLSRLYSTTISTFYVKLTVTDALGNSISLTKGVFNPNYYDGGGGLW